MFQSYDNVEYICADIDSQKNIRKEDITNISFPDCCFDIVVACHVLEHVEDDRKAMQEVHRILKPDGFAILQVPIKDVFHEGKFSKTYEDSSIITPEDRRKHFGQKDHVRIYGRDYQNRLKNSGFKVRVIDFVSKMNKEIAEKYALLPIGEIDNEIGEWINETNGWIFFCTK